MEVARRYWWILAAVVVAALVFWAVSRSGAGKESGKAAKAADAGARADAAAEDEEGIELRARVEQQKGRRKVRLEIGDEAKAAGVALLELEDAAEEGEGEGEGTIVAPDPESGHAFIEAIARWFKLAVPPKRTNPTPLVPLEIAYVQLSKAEGTEPETLRLLLQRGSLEAELFLNLSADGTKAALLDNDQEQREHLLAILAVALRDGPMPKRTAKTDPNLASDEPLIKKLVPLKAECSRFAFTDKSLLCAREGSLLEWKDVKQPPKSLVKLSAEVAAVFPAPDGERVAVALALAKREAEPEADEADDSDARWVVLWERKTGATHELASVVDGVEGVRWSPDGKLVAIELGASEDAGGGRKVRVHDAATRKVIGTTPVELDLALQDWRGQEMTLVHLDPDAEPPVRELYTWRPGPERPTRAESAPAITSPDGKYALSVDNDALRVREQSAGAAERTFRATNIDDRSALGEIETPPLFIGPHGLVFPAEELFVLDLRTLKLQRAFADDAVGILAISPDTRRVIAANTSDQLFFAEVP